MKIGFFTASEFPTSGENVAIAALKAFEQAGFSVAVRAANRPQYQGGAVEDFDYIASTGIRPSAYANTGDYPEFDPASPPLPPGYPAPSPTQAIVTDGQVIEGTGGAFTVSVAGGVVTGGTWEADE